MIIESTGELSQYKWCCNVHFIANNT